MNSSPPDTSPPSRSDIFSLALNFYHWLCLAVLIGVSALGISFTFTFPAFQVADEDMHWFTANRNYERLATMFGARTAPQCGQAQALSQKFDINSLKSNLSVKLPDGELERGAEIVAQCPPITPVDRSSLLSYPGVVIARMLVRGENDSPAQAVSVFYLSRLLQGGVLIAVFLRLLWLFARSGGRGGFGLLSVLLFCFSPMVINQSFGISYDMILVAATTYGVGLLLFHCSVTVIDVVVLMCLLWGAASGKPVYLPLAAVLLLGLGFLLYRTSNRSGGNRASVALIGVGLPSLFIMSFLISSSELKGAEAAMSWRPDIDPRYNLAFLWADLSRAWKILWGSAWAHMHISWMSSPLGWTNVHIRAENQNCWISLLQAGIAIDLAANLFVLLKNYFSINRSKVVRGWLGNTGLSILILLGAGAYMLLCSLAMYLMWTPKDTLGVHGLQNRYYLPVYVALIGAAMLLVSGGAVRQQEHGGEKTRAIFFVFPLIAALLFLAFLAPLTVGLSVDVLKRFY